MVGKGEITTLIQAAGNIAELENYLERNIGIIMATGQKERFGVASNMCLTLEMLSKFDTLEDFKKCFFE